MFASKLIAIKNARFFVCVEQYPREEWWSGCARRLNIYKENSGFVLFPNEAHNDNVVHAFRIFPLLCGGVYQRYAILLIAHAYKTKTYEHKKK